MRMTVVWAMAAGAAVSLAAASPAMADDLILPTPGDGPADVAIQQLQAAGYTVSINWLEGHPNVPLRECKVTGISGLTGSTKPNEFETAYVDVSCPNAK